MKPVWIFGIDRNVQNFVGHADYGQYQALLSFCIIFQIFLDFGLQSFNSRSVAQAPETMQTLFPNIVWAKIFLSAVYFVLIICFGLLIGFRGYSLVLLLLLGFVQILNSFLLFLRSNVSGMHRFKTDSILSVSDKLLMIIICGILLYLPPWKHHFRIEWFIYAQIASYLISALLAFVVCLRLTHLEWRKFHPAKVWTIARKSLPYAVLIFFMSIYLRADSVILERILPNGKEEAGIFAASFRLLDVANNMTGVLFAGILLPMFGRLLAKRESVRPLIHQSLNLLLPVAFTTLALAGFWGNELMHLLYTEATPYDGKVFFLLMCSFPGFCIGYVYATLLTANGNLRPLIYISLFAVIVNLGLNFLLIPFYGALGAAFSCAATQVLLSFLNIWLAGKFIQLKFDIKWILRYLLFCFLMVSIGWLLAQTSFPILFKIVGMAADGLICMAICGFLPFRRLKETLRISH